MRENNENGREVRRWRFVQFSFNFFILEHFFRFFAKQREKEHRSPKEENFYFQKCARTTRAEARQEDIVSLRRIRSPEAVRRVSRTVYELSYASVPRNGGSRPDKGTTQHGVTRHRGRAMTKMPKEQRRERKKNTFNRAAFE